MSTKIYNAYRVKKSTDILEMFHQMRTELLTGISQDENLLRDLHELTKEFLGKSKIFPHHIRRFLESNEKSLTRTTIDLYLACTVFYDKKYWYLKFFPNSYLMEKTVVKFAKIYGLENYEYQNQCDPPDDMPTRKYEARIKKWDALLGHGKDTFSKGLEHKIICSKDIEYLLLDELFKPDGVSLLAYRFEE